jgi:outer membrane murein-binding lipoprotein Lpp
MAMKRTTVALVATLLLAAVAHPARSSEQATTSWQELEEKSAALDRRVIELQHDIRAARHGGDQGKLEQAEKELKGVQEQRVETLRAMGHLR